MAVWKPAGWPAPRPSMSTCPGPMSPRSSAAAAPPQPAHRATADRGDLWPNQLARPLAGPTQLEQIWRAHWTIENRVHYVRDETLGEDRCQVGPAGPQALAAFRNAVLSLLRFHGWSNIAAAARNYASHPQRALRLLGVPAL